MKSGRQALGIGMADVQPPGQALGQRFARGIDGCDIVGAVARIPIRDGHRVLHLGFELEQPSLHLVFGLFTQLVNGLIDRFVCFQ